MNNKSNIILTSVALIALLLVTISATYAYFSSKTDNNTSLNVGAEMIIGTAFTAYTLDQLELNVTTADMFEPSTSAAVTDTGKVVVTLSSPRENMEVSCSYDIELVWDTTDQYLTPTTTLQGNYLYELSLAGTQEVIGDTTGNTYSVSKLNETNLTSFTWAGTEGAIGRKAKVITDAQIHSKSTEVTSATWTFNLNFYSLPTDQSALGGKNYAAHLTVSDVIC